MIRIETVRGESRFPDQKPTKVLKVFGIVIWSWKIG